MNSTEYTEVGRYLAGFKCDVYIFREFVYAFESMFTFYMYMDAYGLWFNYVTKSNIGPMMATAQWA